MPKRITKYQNQANEEMAKIAIGAGVLFVVCTYGLHWLTDYYNELSGNYRYTPTAGGVFTASVADDLHKQAMSASGSSRADLEGTAQQLYKETYR